MVDRSDALDIKQKLVDIEMNLERNHRAVMDAIGVVDNQVGKLTEILTALVQQLGEGSTS